MIEWSEEHKAFRDVVRRFIDSEIRPRLDELEHGDTPPYDVLRKLVRTLGIGEFQKQRFEAQLAAEKAGTEKKSVKPEGESKPSQARADASAMQLILVTELCRVCPGMVTAMGVSSGLTAGTIMSRGTLAQKERFVPALLTLEKIGAWAITEPGSGSDAFGAMKSTCRRDGDHYLLSGQKTFITNGPYADTLIFICKLDDGVTPPEKRKVLSFILDRGMPGLAQSKPLRKMGQHSSPTGELFLEDVRVPKDRLLGETEEISYRSGARDTFSSERSGTPAMALGIVEECLSRSVEYAKTRVQFGRPIGEFQLIQQKLAKMEVARMNIQNMSSGRSSWLRTASASALPRLPPASYTAPRPRWRSRSRRCRCSAATATWPSTASSNCAATPRSCRSTPAPTRSRHPKSPATYFRAKPPGP